MHMCGVVAQSIYPCRLTKMVMHIYVWCGTIRAQLIVKLHFFFDEIKLHWLNLGK